MQSPKRIFLDTSVINFIVDHSEIIFDGCAISEKINERIYNDIRGLAQIFYYADHNAIEMVISKTTFNEIQATSNKVKREKLLNYCSELWN